MSSQVTSLGGLAAFRFSERWVANSNSKFTARSYWSCEMSETEGTDLNAMEREPPIWTPPIGQISSGWQQAASLILCAALIVAGVYILSNYLRALVWALVLAVHSGLPTIACVEKLAEASQKSSCPSWLLLWLARLCFCPLRFSPSKWCAR